MTKNELIKKFEEYEEDLQDLIIYPHDFFDALPVYELDSFYVHIDTLLKSYAKKHHRAKTSEEIKNWNRVNNTNKKEFVKYILEGDIPKAAMLYILKYPQKPESKTDVINKFKISLMEELKLFCDDECIQKHIKEVETFFMYLLESLSKNFRYQPIQALTLQTYKLEDSKQVLQQVTEKIQQLLQPFHYDGIGYDNLANCISNIWDNEELKQSLHINNS